MDQEKIEEFLRKLPQNSISITAINPNTVSPRKSPASKPKPNSISVRLAGREIEDEAIILKRFHDAQRMARFRAKRKKTLEENHQPQVQLHVVSPRHVARRSVNIETDAERQRQPDIRLEALAALASSANLSVNGGGGGSSGGVNSNVGGGSNNSPDTESKYAQLLAIIERIGKDVRLSYAGSRSSAERLKSGIAKARSLVRDCLIETRLNLR